MKEFAVGLLVVVMVLVLSGVGILLLPFFLVLGLFLKLIIGVLLLILVVWLIGKATLFLIDLMKPKEPKKE